MSALPPAATKRSGARTSRKKHRTPPHQKGITAMKLPFRRRPERPVVRRLSTAFLLTGKTARAYDRTERITTELLMPGACSNCDPADIICEMCDKAWSV